MLTSVNGSCGERVGSTGGRRIAILVTFLPRSTMAATKKPMTSVQVSTIVATESP